ncbi:MAG: hypothetical protein ABI113_13420 [Mucilaginibacter sp.]
MAAFHGIQVYEILENGNLLNGIYTNTGLLNTKYDIDNEIARKKKYDNEGVEGLYDCSYIESNNNAVKHCDLKISKLNGKGVYKFTWIDQNNKPIWKGLGLIAGTTHIAVSYEDA